MSNKLFGERRRTEEDYELLEISEERADQEGVNEMVDYIEFCEEEEERRVYNGLGEQLTVQWY